MRPAKQCNSHLHPDCEPQHTETWRATGASGNANNLAWRVSSGRGLVLTINDDGGTAVRLCFADTLADEGDEPSDK